MGCCSGRKNDEGNVGYSKDNAQTIINEIKNKGDLKAKHKDGWRTHHVVTNDKETVNFLSLVIENYPEILKEEGFLTVSEESLKGTHGEGKKNYEHILSSPELVEALVKNYKEYGTSIKDAEISAYFHDQKNKAEESHKNSYELLRKAFEIGEAKPAEVKPTPTASQDANVEKTENAGGENNDAAAS